ncbi:MAG: hypothetical protein OXN89_08380 [Bryobacterales bacterium]|nr:hypothetical protein [Bryobacterales bacterium]
MIETLAGIGERGFNGDGIPASRAQLSDPSGLAADRFGNLYVADQYNYRIRRIDPEGVITTVAGTGKKGHSGDGGKATEASLDGPTALAIDRSGNLYFAEFYCHRVRRVDPEGLITTIAGTGEQGCACDGCPAVEAPLDGPAGLAVDGDGNVFVSESGNHRVRRISSDGLIATVAGTAMAGYVGDGGKATEALLWSPKGLATDRHGNLFVSDSDNHRVRRIDQAGIITTVAGTGEIHYSGDGGLAVLARLFHPNGLATDRADNIYVADVGNHRVRRIDRAGVITTVVGTGEIGFRAEGDGGPAFEANVYAPSALAIDRGGFLLVADRAYHNVRIVRFDHELSVGLGKGGEQHVFEFAAYGTLWREGRSYADGSQVTAKDGNTFVLQPGAGGTFTARRQYGTQSIALPGGSTVHLIPGADGTWRIGSRKVATGDRYVHQGVEHVLDFFGDRWRLVEHTVLDLIRKPDLPEGIPAVQADLDYPSDVAADRSGNIYVTEFGSGRVRRIDSDGLISTVADARRRSGSGSVDDASWFWQFLPERLAVDERGNVYLSHIGGNRICKVDSDGSTSTFAGMGPVYRGHAGEGVPATEALLSSVGGIASDGRGQLYFSDMHNHCIRRVDAQGTIDTIAGAGAPGFGGDGGPAREGLLDSPAGLSVDESGAVYFADQRNARVRRISKKGIIETVAGGGSRRLATVDGIPATTARLKGPLGVAADPKGSIYIAEWSGYRVRRVSVDGIITTLAGTGDSGKGGDFELGTESRLGRPAGVAADSEGHVYVVDTTNNRVRRVGQDGRIETIAGTGKNGCGGDGGSAREALLSGPCGVAVDGVGNVYIADTHNHRIRKVYRSGLISTIAGTGTAGYGGDGRQASRAIFNLPMGVAVDARGNVYVSDFRNHRLRKIDPSGTVSTVAGTGEPGCGGDGGPAVEAKLHSPELIATDALGNVFLAERDNDRVRKVSTEGIITTVAGSGRRGFQGDRGTAKRAFLCCPAGVAVDPDGNVYVADYRNDRVRVIDRDGIIRTFAGGGEVFATGDGGPAEEACLEQPQGIAVDPSGTVYVAERYRHRIRKFAPGGQISTVAGTGEAAYWGDGGPAVAALLKSPEGLAADASGNVYVADSGNHRLRRIDRSGVIETIAGAGGLRTMWEGGPRSTSLIKAIAGDAHDRLCMLTSDHVWRLEGSQNVVCAAGTAEDGHPEESGSVEEPFFEQASRLAADKAGNFYVAEECSVYRIDPSGAITTFAGTGERSGGWRRPKKIPHTRDIPTWVAADEAGNVYYFDARHMRIRKICSSGETATVADLKMLLDPEERVDFESGWGLPRDFIAADAAGNLFLASPGGNTIRKIAADGSIGMFAGAGENGDSGDGGLATLAHLSSPASIATDSVGNLYLVELYGKRIRKIDSTGTISTVFVLDVGRSDGDGKAAIPADIAEPASVAADAAGNVYVSDWKNDSVVRIDPLGTVQTFTGSGERNSSADVEHGGAHKAPSADVRFRSLNGLAADVAGTVYVADSANHRVCAIGPEGGIKTIAGTGEPGFGGDGGPATEAALDYPCGVAVDPYGNVYIADSGNRSVRKVDTSGVISSMYHEPPTSAPPPGYEGDGGPAVQARFVGPLDIAADAQGNLYVADAGDHRVRKIGADGRITMFAGTGRSGHEGDGGPASEARLDYPYRVATDPAGNVYVFDNETSRIRRVDSNGVIVTIAGTGVRGYSGDDGPAIEADVNARDIAADSDGNVFLVDNRRVRKIDRSGTISTVAGSGRLLAQEDGGPPVSAHLLPRLVATSRTGDVWFVDHATDRVRVLRQNLPR